MKKNIGIAMMLLGALLTGCSGATTAKTGVSTDVNEAAQPLEDGTFAQPEGYPSKTVEFVVPAAAGAMIDIPTRTMVDLLNKTLEKPAVVVNMDGASQTIGTTEVKNRAADGYTFLTATVGGMLMQPHMMDLTYAIDDFRHIAMIQPGDQMLLVTTPDSKFQSWDELEDMLEAGERVTWSTSNAGGLGHLGLLEVLESKKLSAEFIPFNGSNEGIAALLGGHIDAYVIDASTAIPRIEEGQYIPLLLLDDKRRDELSEVTAAGEIGVEGMEDYVGYKWIAVHKDTPDAIVQWMKQQIDTVVQSQEYQDYIKSINMGTLRVYTEEEVTELAINSSETFKEAIAALE